MKPLYIIIGVLVLILVFLLIGSKATGQSGDASKSSDTGSDSLNDGILNILQGGKNCDDECQQLCKSCRTLFGGRQKCRRECESDCAKGKDYVSIYPNCG